MDVGSVLDGKDAVKEGLIDSLGSLSDAIDCLYDMIDEYKAEQNKNLSKSKKSTTNNTTKNNTTNKTKENTKKTTRKNTNTDKNLQK
jgi:ClpP class serine protease